MNILVFSSYMDAWNSVRPEAEMFIEMVKLGHQVTIVTQGNAEYVTRFKECGLKVIDCYPTKKLCYETIKTLRKELTSTHYDIVYAMNSKTIPNAAFACIGLKKTKLVTYRGTVGGLYRHDPTAYLTHLHPRVDGISCVAQAVTDDVKKNMWGAKDKVTTIYKGHDLTWYQTSPLKRESLNIPENAIIVTCIANARVSKGVHILLASAKTLSHIENLHIVLVGRDMDTPDNLTLAQNSGMKERIHFLGYRTDVPQILATSDIQIQPSISGEGLPKTVIEAMAMSIPSIVTTTGGSKELIIEGESGFVIPVNDAQAIAEKVQLLCNNEALRLSMGKQAQKHLATHFSIQKTTLNHIDFFQSLMER